jgi:cysteinyl-tRNA synthetase
MNFTWEALEGAQTALNKLRNKYLESADGEINIPGEFVDAINVDLNLPKALSVIWENIDDLNKPTLTRIDEVLGLSLAEFGQEEIEVPKEVEELVNKREELRRLGKYEDADRLRDEIVSKGFALEDFSDGAKVKKA